MKRQWFYRGSLKSCNYSCSYCPFSKNKGSNREQEKDKTAWLRFVEYLNSHKDFGGALQVVPYGEALIHPYYWVGLAAISQNPEFDIVGAQSNFSFPVNQMLSLYQKQKGRLDKLRLWGTFHPQMTTIEQFLNQCRLLSKWNVSYCVGAVGVPENLQAIRNLQNALPPSVYVWINKMDGLGRRYTPEEKEAFLTIDPYFEMELIHHKSDTSLCGTSRFIEADGTMRQCNLCRRSLGNLYSQNDQEASVWKTNQDKNNLSETEINRQLCNRKECSCYLAYSNRKEPALSFFQPFPAFRIPVYPRAVFFDIDGTLIPDGQTKIPEQTAKKLRHLSKYSTIYLATSRPYETARKGLSPVWDTISGGTFAGGGRRMIWKQDSMDEVTPLDTSCLPKIMKLQKTTGFQLRIYRQRMPRPANPPYVTGNDLVYKVTLICQRGRMSDTAAKKLLEQLTCDLEISGSCQFLWEAPCLQITAQGTGKLEGILQICRRMGYQKEEVAVFGNSRDDMAIMKYFSQ